MASREYKRKLIEVDLPLNAINAESAREKFARNGHPLTMHTYWARRPLASCRAVIFASLVDDPIDWIDEFPTEDEQIAERNRLHGLLTRLARWDNVDERTTDGESLIQEVRLEIARSLARSRGEPAPIKPNDVLAYLTDEESGITIYDPFCGGGSIPLEAQRLGVNAIGSDLNPLAVLITKATIELPTPFKDHPPVNPSRRKEQGSGETYGGYSGLAVDIRHYGACVGDEVQAHIGRLYPEAQTYNGNALTVVAWLWANTVPCSNPACNYEMPLIRSFQLSKHPKKPRWIRPDDSRNGRIGFSICDVPSGTPWPGTVANRQAMCLACETVVPLQHVRNQAKSGKMKQQLVAIAAQGDNGREFLPPDEYHERVAQRAVPPRRPQGSLPEKARSISTQGYGLTEWHQLFTERQLTMLCAFSDALGTVHEEVLRDGASQEYANAIRTYLSISVGRMLDLCSRLSWWENGGMRVARVFGRQAIGMVWDFAELNPFCSVTQNWAASVESVGKVVERLPLDVAVGTAYRADAANADYLGNGPVIVTDPPYYDNIGYADISDFFYVWHRDMLADVYPELFLGRQTPKSDEIVAGPMFEKPKERFESLMAEVLRRVRKSCTDEHPSSIFYAYKQREEEKDGVTSTGWETFLSAVNDAGFKIVGTWPMRTEKTAKLNALKGNMLASSVVLVTRPRESDAPSATRQEFIHELEQTLPSELDRLTRDGHIAPIDLSQAAIGPGMKVYTKYSSVETIAGEPVTVKDALKEINRVMGKYFLEQHGELDSETQFCLDWLAAHDFNEGPFGDAETLAKAKDVAVDSLRDEHKIVKASRNSVQLIPYSEIGAMPELTEVSPATSAWLGLMCIAWHFDDELGRGIEGAGNIIRDMTGKADQVERLARILFDHYDRKFKPSDASVYNDIADSWPGILEQSRYGRQLTQ